MSSTKWLLEKLEWQTKEDFIKTMESEQFGRNEKIIEFIETVFLNEISLIQKRTETIKIKTQNFLKLKLFKNLILSSNLILIKSKYLNLLDFDFIETKKCFVCKMPGVGKTNFAIFLGLKRWI